MCTMNYVLRQLPPNNLIQPIEIHLTDDEFQIGRRRIISLMKYPQISRKHATFYKTDNGTLFVKDLNSLNGIYVNGEKIGSSLKPLSVGDVIGFGVPTTSMDEGFVCTLCVDNSSDEVKDYQIDQATDKRCCTTTSSGTKLPSTDSVLQISVLPGRNTSTLITWPADKISNKSCISQDSDNTSDGFQLIPSEILPTKVCSVPLTKCDSKYFKWPPGVKKPFFHEHKYIQYLRHTRKRARQISSESSSSEEEENYVKETFPSSSCIKNKYIPLKIQNKNINIIPQSRNVGKQEFIQVIDCFDSSGETSPVSQKELSISNGINILPDYHIKNEVHKENFEKKLCLTNEVINKFPDSKVKDAANKESLESQNDPCKVLSYSKVDEIIYISDNETCLDGMKYDDISNFPVCNIKSEVDKGIPKEESCLVNDGINKFADCNARNEANKENFKEKPCLTSDGMSKFPDCNVKNAADKESLESLNDICKVLNYSQEEEIIYISDDENYLDFKSSQNFAQVKIEPEETDVSDNEIWKVVFKNGAELTSDTCVPRNNEVDFNKEESVESVHTSVNCIVQENPKEHTFDTSEGNNSTLINKEVFQIFPQNFNKNEVNSVENDSDLMHSDILTVVGNNIQQTPEISNENKVSEILLMDPKPMSYHPHRARERDEGLVAQNKCVNAALVEQKRKRGRPIKVTKNLQPTSSQSQHTKSNGGLAVSIKSVNSAEVQQKRKRGRPRKEPSENKDVNSITIEKTFKIPRKSKALDLIHKDVLPKEVNSINAPVNPSSSLSAEEVQKRSVKTVKVRPEKFSSRMGFLINELEINPQKRSKAVSKSGTLSSMSKDKSEEVQHLLLNETDVSAKNNSAQVTVSSEIAAHESVTTSFQIFNTCSTFSNSRDPRLKSLQSHDSKSAALLSMPISTAKMCYPLPNACAIPGNSLPHNLSFQGLVNSLIHLNTKWLQEQETLEIPPAAIIDSAASLPLNFKSYESYAASFFPMIKLEIWESMYSESKQSNQFYFSVLSCTSNEDFIELKCESVVNENVCFVPREGTITILEIKERSHMCCPLFGYISKHRIGPLNMDSLRVSDWKKLPEEWLTNASHWTFSACIRKKETSFDFNCLMKGRGLCYIRSKLRLADALHYVKDSPLLGNVLEPQLSAFSTNYFVSSSTREYTRHQMEVIRGINAEIVKSQLEPKIILLHGPPGTGKTHTIIGLLEMLFYNCKNRCNLKILITAPSNVAIDEIGCRLSELNEQFSWKDYSIKFVRVGKVLKQIHPKMIPYFLDKKAADLYQLNSQACKRREKELQALCAEIARLEQTLASVDGQEKLQHLRKQYHYFQKQPSTKEMNHYTEMTYKANILKESNVVLSTLSSCGLPIMLRAFKQDSGSHFSCCIVDESTQSTELEILQPLMLGVSKLVLVGDEKQLPSTVLSKFALRCGLGRSMFERFRLHFQKAGEKSPILILNEQLRMHIDICEFPSKHIYTGTLETHPDTALRYKEFHLHPYIVFDIPESPVASNNQPFQGDCSETSIMFNICKFLTDVVDCPSSIGIITASQAQRFLYMKTLYTDPLYKEIEINTVDVFQGREKDVIVVSCLNANHHPGGKRFLHCTQRLNVALTRAKQCLILCVHSAALGIYPDWKVLIEDARSRGLLFPVTSSNNLLLVLRNRLEKK